jgi:AcrR family transcriptional regulator
MIHEALLYSSDEELTDTLVPFLRDGVDAGQAAIVVLEHERSERLRAALGPAAEGVTFGDARAWLTRPGTSLTKWAAALDSALADGSPFVRAVGEPPFATAADTCAEGWKRLESTLNGLYADRPIWFICPYDARVLSAEALDAAARTHPTLVSASGRTPSKEYFATPDVGAPVVAAEEEEATETSSAVAGNIEELAAVREAVVGPAGSCAHLLPPVTQDLARAVDELVRAALAADYGPATIRTAQTTAGWFCEVRLSAGSASALVGGTGRIGFAIARIICDRVELADNATHSFVRLTFTPAKRPPRERILSAADDLFRRNGIRSASVNEIVAAAGVAKATFYAHFRGKADLIAEWYRVVTAGWLDSVREGVAARAPSPADRLTTFFDVLHDWMQSDLSRGGGRLSLSAELRDPRHPAQLQRDGARDDVKEYFRLTASDAGLSDPETVARGLTLLLQGAMDQAVELGSPEPALTARAAAEHIVAAARP